MNPNITHGVKIGLRDSDSAQNRGGARGFRLRPQQRRSCGNNPAAASETAVQLNQGGGISFPQGTSYREGKPASASVSS